MGKLKEKDVELFLLENRDFFVNHPAILAEMDFEEEKGGVSSLLQRQIARLRDCLLYTSPSPRDQRGSRMPSSA